jgi:hypothetical protein
MTVTDELQRPAYDDETLLEKLRRTAESLPPGGVTLAEIRDLIGRDGMMLLAAFLTLIFLVPVSIPGVSTVFGGGILLIGISRLFRRDLWLPAKLARRQVSSDKLRGALLKGLGWFQRLERISKTYRMAWLSTGNVVRTFNDLALILGAGLLMAPFGLIPFSNTLPAIAILFLAIGFLQRDGVCILLGYLMNVATIVYFGVLISGGAVAIRELFQRLF